MADKCKHQFIRVRERPAIPLASDTDVTPSLRGFSAYWREVQERTVGVSVHNMDTLHGNEPDIEEYKTVLMPVTATHTTYMSKTEFAAFERRFWLLSLAVILTFVLFCVVLVVAWLLVMSNAIRGMA